MNTVDSLKNLYKTLCGKDYAGDPNPTDAEMINAIAKDATPGGGGGGSGSGGGRIIELTKAQGSFLPIEPNLPIEYFAGACFGFNGQYFIIKSIVENYDGQGNVTAYYLTITTLVGTMTLVYFLSDGHISMAGEM